MTINAIFACSDLLGIAAINAAAKNHIAVPNDLIIVGFDNIKYSVMSSPTLTTASQPMFQMGYRCSEMLYQLIVNPSAQLQSVVLQTELIIREST
ncbi:MAG: substrate-binding domain-containing protein [Lachnospiraceae bacterium]|nr:substrate-binding domain-containing protein [Lachnospiraceae bacterium]